MAETLLHDVTIDGRSGTVVYLDKHFTPVGSPEQADFAKVVFADGGSMFLTPQVQKFDESKHPRHPKGSAQGGEFAALSAFGEVDVADAEIANWLTTDGRFIRRPGEVHVLGKPGYVHHGQAAEMAGADHEQMKAAGTMAVYLGPLHGGGRQVTVVTRTAPSEAQYRGIRDLVARLDEEDGPAVVLTDFLVGGRREQAAWRRTNGVWVRRGGAVVRSPGGDLQRTLREAYGSAVKRFNPDQHPRVPAGSPQGGEFTTSGGGDTPEGKSDAEVLAAARREYGTTDQITPGSAYLLPEGDWLEFGYQSGSRDQDHRNISSVEEDIEGDDSGTLAMIRFQRRGAVRIHVSPAMRRGDDAELMLDFEVEPTGRQRRAIAEAVRDLRASKVYIDVSEDGDRLADSEVELFRHGDANPVMEAIDQAFEEAAPHRMRKRFNPAQPRVPAGSPEGGEWAAGDAPPGALEYPQQGVSPRHIRLLDVHSERIGGFTVHFGRFPKGKPILLYRGVGDLDELRHSLEGVRGWRTGRDFTTTGVEGVLQLGGDPHEIAAMDRGEEMARAFNMPRRYRYVFEVDVQGLEATTIMRPVTGRKTVFQSGMAGGLGMGLASPISDRRITRAWEVVDGKLGRRVPKEELLRLVPQAHSILKRLRALIAKFNPNQPRVPAGEPTGGQWTSGQGDFFPEEAAQAVGFREARAMIAAMPPNLPRLSDDDLKALKFGDLDRAADIQRKLRVEEAEQVTLPNGWKVWVYGGTSSRVERMVVDWEDGDDTAYESSAEEFINEHADKMYPDWEDEFARDFWENPTELYHGTDPENVESIEREGLDSRNETRGLGNRHVGHAVFTSTDTDLPSSYGSAIFEIDTEAMKRDGFMPRVFQEPSYVESEQRRALADRLGIEDYYSESLGGGEDPETVILDDSIPAKYLRLLASYPERAKGRRYAKGMRRGVMTFRPRDRDRDRRFRRRMNRVQKPRSILKRLQRLIKRFNPDQPRDPAGTPTGGQWTATIASQYAKLEDEGRIVEADQGLSAVPEGLSDLLKTELVTLANREELDGSTLQVAIDNRGDQLAVYIRSGEQGSPEDFTEAIDENVENYMEGLRDRGILVDEADNAAADDLQEAEDEYVKELTDEKEALEEQDERTEDEESRLSELETEIEDKRQEFRESDEYFEIRDRHYAEVEAETERQYREQVEADYEREREGDDTGFMEDEQFKYDRLFIRSKGEGDAELEAEAERLSAIAEAQYNARRIEETLRNDLHSALEIAQFVDPERPFPGWGEGYWRDQALERARNAVETHPEVRGKLNAAIGSDSADAPAVLEAVAALRAIEPQLKARLEATDANLARARAAEDAADQDAYRARTAYQASREATRPPAGVYDELSVGLLEVGSSFQGQGIVTQMLGSAMLSANKVGVQRVTATANLDAGGYAWARLGMLPTNESWETLRTVAHSRLSEIHARLTEGTPESLAEVDRNYPGLRGVTSPSTVLVLRDAIFGVGAPRTNLWRVADLRLGSVNLGKNLLRHVSYKAEFDFRNPEQVRRAGAFFARALPGYDVSAYTKPRAEWPPLIPPSAPKTEPAKP